MSAREFHRGLRSRGRGAKDWSNTFTEHEYLGVDESGRHKFSVGISSSRRVFKDKEDNQWKKRKLTDNLPDHVVIQSAQICTEVYPYYTKYFDVQHEEVRVEEERWIIQRLFKMPDTWRDVGVWNPVIVVEELIDAIKVTVTYDTDYGSLVVEYFQRDGSPLKHNVTFTNTSGNIEKFQVIQRWTGVAAAKVKHRDGEDTISAAKTIHGHSFKFFKADGGFGIFENQWAMCYDELGEGLTDHNLKPVEVDIHPSGLKADFVFGDWVLAQGESLKIDPDTATLNNPTIDGYIEFDEDVPGTYVRYASAPEILMDYDAGTNKITRGFVEWDVSSIPDGSDVTDTVFKYDGKYHEEAEDAHIHEMLGVQPSDEPDNNAGNLAIYNEAGQGTVYYDVAGFPVVAAAQSADLGAAADTDLENSLAGDWFAIGFQADDESADSHFMGVASEEQGGVNPPPTLYVVYTPPGWSGKISGVVNPAKIAGVAKANIAEVKGVA